MTGHWKIGMDAVSFLRKRRKCQKENVLVKVPVEKEMALSNCVFWRDYNQEMTYKVLRQAGTWDPELPCCSACTWTHLSSNNKIQRNNKGLKLIVCMASWVKFWTKDTERPKNPYCHFWRTHSKNRVLGTKQGTEHAPCTQHHQRGGQTN